MKQIEKSFKSVIKKLEPIHYIGMGIIVLLVCNMQPVVEGVDGDDSAERGDEEGQAEESEERRPFYVFLLIVAIVITCIGLGLAVRWLKGTPGSTDKKPSSVSMAAARETAARETAAPSSASTRTREILNDPVSPWVAKRQLDWDDGAPRAPANFGLDPEPS